MLRRMVAVAGSFMPRCRRRRIISAAPLSPRRRTCVCVGPKGYSEPGGTCVVSDRKPRARRMQGDARGRRQ